MSSQSPLPEPHAPGLASAIILAGGKSSRMGQPKALLLFDDAPLIVHLVRMLRDAFSDVVVVAAPGQGLPPIPATLVHDDVAYQGPVGGIYYGLLAAQEELCFVTSCDAPFLQLNLVHFLLSLAVEHDVVVPHWQARLQPLFAVYRRSVAPLLHQQLERNELRPIFLYDKVRTRRVSEEELLPFDPEGLSFRNMNSPEEYQAALVLWQKKQKERQKEKADTALLGNARSQRPASALQITVELFGVARLKAQTAIEALTLPSDATLAEALLALGVRCPNLLGSVLSRETSALLPGYACNLNGREFMKDARTVLSPGDQLLIFSSDAGG